MGASRAMLNETRINVGVDVFILDAKSHIQKMKRIGAAFIKCGFGRSLQENTSLILAGLRRKQMPSRCSMGPVGPVAGRPRLRASPLKPSMLVPLAPGTARKVPP